MQISTKRKKNMGKHCHGLGRSSILATKKLLEGFQMDWYAWNVFIQIQWFEYQLQQDKAPFLNFILETIESKRLNQWMKHILIKTQCREHERNSRKFHPKWEFRINQTQTSISFNMLTFITCFQWSEMWFMHTILGIPSIW